MEYEDKVLALAKHLDVNPALISESYNYYSVNERVVKRGKSPEQIKETAEDFRAILDTGMQGLISATLQSDRTKEQVDEVYAEVKKSLEPLADKAAKLKKMRESRPGMIGEKTDLWRNPALYLKLQADNLYVENVLYHLLKSDSDYAIQLQKAWIGAPVDDIREDTTINDGEYLVMTDSEADQWEQDGLENLFEEQTYEVPEHLTRFMDVDKFVQEYSGNRGENISGYDGQEYEQEFEGETYYIYRNN